MTLLEKLLEQKMKKGRYIYHVGRPIERYSFITTK
jgi:hypothetical protein